MKKLAKFYLPALLLASAFIFNACGDEDDPAPAPSNNNCDSAVTYPVSQSNLAVSFLNFPGNDSIININASAGSVLTVSVNMVKGADNARPQKLRLYQAGCDNFKGSIINLSGQPNAQDGGNRVDLRNVDEQVRTVFFTVPSGVNPLYVTFEIDLNNDRFVYKRLKINVSGSGLIDTHNNVILGGNTNALPSRMSAATGVLYKACETAENIAYIDITYGVTINTNSPATAVDQTFLMSNPARNTSFGLSVGPISCDGGTDNVLTGGGNATYFVKLSLTSAQFDAATDATINSISVSSSNNQYVQVAAGDILGFQKSSGRKGIIRVDAITQSGTPASNSAGTIQLDVKVQR